MTVSQIIHLSVHNLCLCIIILCIAYLEDDGEGDGEGYDDLTEHGKTLLRCHYALLLSCVN